MRQPAPGKSRRHKTSPFAKREPKRVSRSVFAHYPEPRKLNRANEARDKPYQEEF